MLDRGFSDSRPAIGGKRSIRDRLGTDVDGFQLNNKRCISLFIVLVRELVV